MKRLNLFILLVSVSFSCIAQNIGDTFYIYRNDGEFNAFFRDEVISIEFSYEDADGNNYDEIVTQIINTEDSVYKIPLAAIDSISFVQPETVYQEDAIPLEGALFDYLVNSDGMTLTFANNTPSTLIPKVGDKLVTMELTDKLPYGFLGKARQITSSSLGIEVICDSVELDEVVKKFYGTVIMNGKETSNFSSSAPWRAPKYYFRDYDLPNTPFDIPIDISAYIFPLSVFDFNGKAEINVNIVPCTTARVTLVVDGVLSHYNVHVVSNLITKTTIGICGEAQKDFKRNLLPNEGNYRGPWGIPLYFAVGPVIEFSGKAVYESSIDATFDVVSDITYYPQTILPGITGLSPIINRVTGYVKNKVFHYNLDRTGAKGELKASIFFRAGVSTGDHKHAWLGIEAEVGTKCDVDFMFDFARLREADLSTALYDEIKSVCDLEIKPYYGVHFMASIDDDRKTIKIGKEYDFFDKPIFKGGLIPTFSETNLTITSNGTSANAIANISGACPIPYTVGFSLFDSHNNRIGAPHFYDEEYSVLNNFSSYPGTFENLNPDESYKVYPTFKLFGFPVLASPSAETKRQCPVTLSDFGVIEEQYKDRGFANDGQTYDYRFHVCVTATLDNSAMGITEWGYVYLDPNGRETIIPCTSSGSHLEVLFRNEAKSTCTFYGYVKYKGSEEPVYGELHDYPLDYGVSPCRDFNHPHMIDLGLPSGTKWACCNVGATTPEDYGNYYAWGEIQSKSIYNNETYLYYYDDENNPFCWINIGSDIAGTQYDAATANWGNPWRMPTLSQGQELLFNTTLTRTTLNGVSGVKFTGFNGASLFLPAAGSGGYNAGSGCYWSSTLYESNGDEPSYQAFQFGFGYGGGWEWSSTQRSIGFPVRPVR